MVLVETYRGQKKEGVFGNDPQQVIRDFIDNLPSRGIGLTGIYGAEGTKKWTGTRLQSSIEKLNEEILRDERATGCFELSENGSGETAMLFKEGQIIFAATFIDSKK